MWKLTTVFVCSVLAAFVILPDLSSSRDLKIPCDIDRRNSSCPDGYCCVRDDFLFTETYCKQLGTVNSSCITKTSNFECHCQQGYTCEPNIHGPHSSSVFGKCRDNSGSTNGADGSMTTESSSQQTTSNLNQTGNAIVG